MSKTRFTNRQTAKNITKMKKLQTFNEFTQRQRNHSKEVFFVWMGIMLFSVIAAHFLLNLGPDNATGFVTANTNPDENALTGMYALLSLFIVVCAVGVGFFVLTRKDN